MEWRRSNLCGTLRVENLGETVTLMGWCQTRRDHGGVIFVDLRDYTGICQVVFRKEASAEAHERADSIRSEFVIAVRGKVENRICLLYTSPSPRDLSTSRMPSSA